ncbi:MAG: stage 0 sporulation family protein [Chloroflexi bacterium]|nr:stage 0 sporulation family protein [Chloroflexota bacterium]
MPTVVGVRFKRVGKIYYFDPIKMDLHVNDWVVVETSRGREAGQVAIGPRFLSDKELQRSLEPVVRRANTQDMLSMLYYRAREDRALRRCRETVAAQNLLMKVIRAEYSYDGSRLTFYFTAEKRIDFRDLVKELSKSLRTRIEMRQLGPRDEAAIIGAVGPCGRELCCSTWLTEFPPISIKMAKNQDLPLNPTSISGMCGRLRCCLKFEDDYYAVMRELMPRVGQEINTPDGPGQVISLDILKESVKIQLREGPILEMSIPVPVDEVEKRMAQRAAMQAGQSKSKNKSKQVEDDIIEEE